MLNKEFKRKTIRKFDDILKNAKDNSRKIRKTDHDRNEKFSKDTENESNKS
jgi:hypothetical protein